MIKQNNIKFEGYIPTDNFKNQRNFNQKKFDFLSKKIRGNIKEKKNVFHSYSKNFKLNFNIKDLKKYKKFKRIITIGMGGSILGTQAMNSFLKKKINKELIFLNNLDFEKIEKLNKYKNLKNSLFLIISKSGNTIEVLSIINTLKNKANFNTQNTLVVTDNKKSHLNNFAKKLKIKIIFHRNYIGGRYSIFSETSLVPCYLMGIDIYSFRKNILSFLYERKQLLIKNLNNLFKIYDSKKINSLILLNYCEGLEYFLLWCQQLIAESLGKKGKGIIPIISIGPRDHHSLLQLYLEAPKDKYFYIFSGTKHQKLKKNKGFFVDVLNNSNMQTVLEKQKNAMISLLKSKKIPFLSIEIKKRNEQTLGELFSYFILETIFMAEELKINPFNQPAVEQLKILLKKIYLKRTKNNLRPSIISYRTNL